MKEVLRKLNEIDAANKDATKLALLRDFLKSDELFKEVVIMATSGTMHFNIKKLPVITTNTISEYTREQTLHELFTHLKYLTTQSGANAKDKEWVAKLANNLECGTVVVSRILNGDLKCGVTSKSVNKAWPGLIYVVPYQRCTSESGIDNIVYPAYFDEKLDGIFFNVLCDPSKGVEYRSRNGKEYEVKNERLSNAFVKRSRGFAVAYTGEGMIYRNGKVLDRKTGNGIINKILKGTASQEDHDDLIMVIWEALPLKDFWNGECTTPLDKRYNSKFFEDLNDKSGIIRVPFRKLVYSQEEALDLANEFINAGKEGGVVKNLNSIWRDGKSKDWVKLKAVVDIELECVGWEYGKEDSKYATCMGKAWYQSSDGLVKVKVGGGFSDDQRKEDWNDYIGTISTIRFCEVISSKTKVAKSLFLPRFVEHRPDKDVADDFETIERLVKEAKKKSNTEE